jgi:virginiamycin B lyase
MVITAGPDGALWFTNSNPDRIVRITTTGVATQYDFPHPEEFLLSLIAGPDGALWYSTLSGVIGRMTTDGAITAEYQYGPLGSGLFPYDLTVGPDGALWFIWASVDGGDIASRSGEASLGTYHLQESPSGTGETRTFVVPAE